MRNISMKSYHMQKSEREITDLKIIANIIRNGKYASIALNNDNEPYIVTLSYGYDRPNNCLYFHTAKKGLKIEILKKNPVVCGTIIKDLGYKPNQCSHAYCSVVFWGIIIIIEEMKEKKHAFDILLTHLEKNPAALKKKVLSDDKVLLDVCILKLELQKVTGKASN